MLLFKQFSMNGAFSYGKCAIQFNPGLVLLEGKNLDEVEGVSNMAGKSSVFDGMMTTLFEQNSKGQIKDNIINSLGNGTSELELVLDTAGKEVVIRYSRSVSSKSNWEIFENGQSLTKSIAEMKKFIPTLLGMDYNMFSVASYMEQGRLSKFMFMEDKERKDILFRYFGLDKFELFRNEVKNVKKDVSERLIGAMSGLSQLQKIQGLDTSVEELDSQMVILKNKVKKGIPISIREYQGLEKDYNNKLKMVLENPNISEEVKKVEVDLGRGRGRIVWMKDVLSKLKEDKCYVCGHELDSKEFKVKIETELVGLEQYVKDATRVLSQLQEIEWTIKMWNREEETKKLGEFKSRVGDEADYRKDLEELGKLQTQKELLEKNKKTILELTQEKDVCSQMSEVLDFWFEGFSPRGLPAMILGKLLGSLNSCMKSYGDSLGWEVGCIIEDDRLVLKAKDKWKLLKPEFYSGSESMVISLIVSLGLWRWLNMRGKGTNVLFLDEIFAPFDSTMRMRIVDLIKDIAKDRCVVVVTHNEDVKNTIDWDQIWMVEKKNGISNLQVF